MWTPSRRDRPKEPSKVPERARTPRSCVGAARASAKDSRRVRGRATAMAEERAKNEIAGKRFKCGKVGHMSKDLQSNAFVVDKKGLGRDWMPRHGEHRVECAVPLPEGDGKLRIGIDSLTVFPKTPAEY